MTKDNKTGKDTESSKQEPLEKGQEAIKAHRDIVEKGKPEQQKDKEEEKDAEKWHNEG